MLDIFGIMRRQTYQKVTPSQKKVSLHGSTMWGQAEVQRTLMDARGGELSDSTAFDFFNPS